MREIPLMGACRSGVGGLTQAMRAQKVLSDMGISSQVIKNDPAETRGCEYALQYSCAQERQVKEALRRANIRLRGR